MPHTSPPKAASAPAPAKSPRRRRAISRRSLPAFHVPCSIIDSRHSEPRRSTERCSRPAAAAARSSTSASNVSSVAATIWPLARLELLGRERHVCEHRAAGTQHARALGEPARRVDVDEHVAAPDPVDGGVVERHRLDRSLDDVDLGVQSRGRDGRARHLAVQRHRVERDCAHSVPAHELDCVLRVARADVGDEVAPLRPEGCERLEEPVRSARLEAVPQRLVELRLVGPELVELLDRRHQPPAMAGSKITVEPSCTSVSSPSSVRTSSPST